MLNSRPDYYYDEDGGSSSGSDAPSYSQIHHDAVLQTHQSSTRTTPTNVNSILQTHQSSTRTTPTNMNCGLPVGATLVLPQPAPPISDLHHVNVDFRSFPARSYTSDTQDSIQIQSDNAVPTRRSRSRNLTPNSSIGLPAGATLVLPQPAPPISDLHHVDLESRTLPSTSSRRSYPDIIYQDGLGRYNANTEMNIDATVSTRRSRSRNLTPTSFLGSTSHSSPNHHLEAGHRTLPSSSRGRRSQQTSSQSSRLSVPNQRTASVSNTSLTASVDV
jgi:hypothetical protein